MTLPDIRRFAPESWDDDIAGNHRIKEHYKDQIRALRFGGLNNGTNTIIHGDIGTGKTLTARFFTRCLLCQDLDPTTLNPMCKGSCSTCKDDVARYGELGLTRHSLKSDINFMPIDCMLIENASELRERVRYMQDFNGIRIIHLDEISRLVNRGLDEVLLGPLVDLNYLWIASGSDLNGLDPAFLDRFPVKIKTELPSIEELSIWLVHRCAAWNIEFDSEAIVLLAERSNYACRKALKPLIAINAKPTSQRVLTVQIVEDFDF